MARGLKVYVSGLYSGTNPQPGVGIARSIREGYSDADIIGVEYSNRCSGIHWPDLDEIQLHRPWHELNLEKHAEAIRKILDSGAFWLSSNDLEIIWLADVFPEGHPNLLTPSAPALAKVGKPSIPAHKTLPVRIPTFVTTELSDWDLHAFCREHDWKVWLKGPYYEAVRTSTWPDLEHFRRVLSNAWHTDRLYLQTHVTGYEESIMLSAYHGELLDCVYMRKRDLTELSKTWAGDINPVDRELLLPLRKLIRELRWTGGAELEMVRDAEDDLWMLEWNPRFPAWVHGSTIAGHNLPALLVEAASGIDSKASMPNGNEFTRVVLEVPVRPEFPLPALPEPVSGGVGHSLKHPSGLLAFAGRLHSADAENGNGSAPNGSNGNGHRSLPSKMQVPVSFIHDLNEIDLDSLETPASLFLKSTAHGQFRKAQKLAESVSTDQLRVSNAYSIKTNPDERLLKAALDRGFYAEAISLLEVRKALKVGFRPDQVIMNGPAKWWRSGPAPSGKFYSLFCESVEELERVIDNIEQGNIQTQILGVRLRTPNIKSRFGIPVDTPEVFERLIEAVGKVPQSCRFGIHFHMASSNVGVGNWWHLYESMLRWCSSIEALSGRLVECLDVGGGWFPEDLQNSSSDRYEQAVERLPQFLSSVTEIISEPGKAVAQPSMAVAMQILEIRKYSGKVGEVVMDGSIAELPMRFYYPHRILFRSKDHNWVPLERGKTLLLGRLCMEHDIVAADVKLPASAEVGDILVFCDAGAYDRSMSYVFGCG